MVECPYCPKKPRKATKFLVSPKGDHIPLCDSCYRQVKVQAARTASMLRKSGQLESIDPKLKAWIQNPQVAPADTPKKQDS